MGKYAENTEVSQEKSRAEIETTLRRYGAEAFSYISAAKCRSIYF